MGCCRDRKLAVQGTITFEISVRTLCGGYGIHKPEQIRRNAARPALTHIVYSLLGQGLPSLNADPLEAMPVAPARTGLAAYDADIFGLAASGSHRIARNISRTGHLGRCSRIEVLEDHDDIEKLVARKERPRLKLFHRRNAKFLHPSPFKYCAEYR